VKPCCITDCPSYKKWLKLTTEILMPLSLFSSFTLLMPILVYLHISFIGGNPIAKTILSTIWIGSILINFLTVELSEITGATLLCILFGPFMTLFLSIVYIVGKYVKKKRYC